MIREPDFSHVPAMKRLWRDTFGDDEEFIDSYFDYWFSPEYALIYGDCEGMAFLMDVGRYNGKGCGMLYALAVRPEYRGQGIGASLSEAICEKARSLGFGMTVLTPAEDSLFGFYEKRAGFYRGLSAKSYECAPGASPAECCEIPAEEYAALRERLLCGVPHIEMGLRAVKWFAKCGGRLLKIGETCVAAAEEVDGTLFIRELIGGLDEDAGAVCRFFGAGCAHVRVPCDVGDDGMCDVPLKGVFMGFQFR